MRHIQLENTDFEGKNNIYILDDADATALIDTGMATDEMREQFRDGLAEFGVVVADVNRIFLTHWHPDHVGLAGEIQAETGAEVLIHEGDAPLVENRAWEQMRETYMRLFEEWGMPQAKREVLDERLDLEDDVLSGTLADATTFVDGDRFEVGELTLEVVHTPGHTVGLSGFAFDGERGRELFAGDALLPVYTPNVGGADVRVENPLSKYLDTLGRIIDEDYARAWPGHRQPIDDPTGRAYEIIAHHRDRTRRVIDIVSEHGPLDTWSVGAHLFGGLDDIHIIHGPGEAYAHLDHLERHGLLDHTDEGYVTTSAAEDANMDFLFPPASREAAERASAAGSDH